MQYPTRVEKKGKGTLSNGGEIWMHVQAFRMGYDDDKITNVRLHWQFVIALLM